jgi:hypothetical protein
LPPRPLRRPTIPLEDVLGELRLAVIDRQRMGDEWILWIGKEGKKIASIPEDQCLPIYSAERNNPNIYPEEAEAIRRRFNPPKNPSKIITLGLK